MDQETTPLKETDVGDDQVGRARFVGVVELPCLDRRFDLPRRLEISYDDRMAISDSTCWTLIRGAAEGRDKDREDFARCYTPVIRAYLGARWRGSALARELEDATQEVFLDCFRDGGALQRAERDRPGGFQAFLYGVTRVVALRFERAGARVRDRHHAGVDPDDLGGDDPSLSRAFDHAWALSLVREAGRVQAERAERRGSEAARRVELLRARFQEDLPIRDIARRWNADPVRLHREYARAREEFREALLEVVAFHHPGSAAEAERRCAQLLDLV